MLVSVCLAHLSYLVSLLYELSPLHCKGLKTETVLYVA